MAKEDELKEAKETVKVVRSSDHRSHYSIGVIPQWSDDDLRLHLYNEVIEGTGGPYYISTAQVILPGNALSRVIESLQRASSAAGQGQSARVATVPPELAFRTKGERSERVGTDRKKVMKIRRV